MCAIFLLVFLLDSVAVRTRNYPYWFYSTRYFFPGLLANCSFKKVNVRGQAVVVLPAIQVFAESQKLEWEDVAVHQGMLGFPNVGRHCWGYQGHYVIRVHDL